MKRRVPVTLFAVLLAAATQAPSGSASALSSEPAVFLHYSFDGHFNDDSGNNNHGVLFDEGDTAFVSSPAAFGQAWNDPQQTDPNDRVAFTTEFNPGSFQPWTIAFWHDMEGGVSMPLFSNTDGNNRFRVRADSQNRAELRIAGQATIVWDTNLTLAQNGLFHYAIVADPSGIADVDVDGIPGNDHVALYVNGNLIAPDSGQNLTTYATNVSANNIGDGSHTDAGPSLAFETGHGVSDELWIVLGALTADEVASLRTTNRLDTDADDDGVPDEDDNCPSTSNPDQADGDADGTGDVCDPDDDNDGVADSTDNCPNAVNPDQSDADGDGTGDFCDADDDNDGAPDAADNCPVVANPDQSDTDGDGAGNACDLDDDADGVPDAADLCPSSPAGVVVNASGCSIAETCACSATWNNHGAYVACVADTSRAFSDAGFITQAERAETVKQAAQSSCGK